jgi:ketosteroid isomerase-like protein
MGEDRSVEDIAGLVRSALEDGDLRSFADLLDPRVTWGAPDDPSPACQSRRQVLAWYERGRDAGVRARVTEVVVRGDRIVVGLAVSGNRAADGDAPENARWQVLTVRQGRVVDIVGFEERDVALARARVPTSS